MKSYEIRKLFIDFFKTKSHVYINPSKLVNYNDPTLMFTNAGMNQFKNIFLGKEQIAERRLVNSQPCLRISGKHNDIEEVGVDMYHHTLFEMLGNWSMNDYFKKEAIEWSWELLTQVYKLKEEDLYVTVFAGNNTDRIDKDYETYDIWRGILPEDHILFFGKKDNFWEMGDMGPCGPCTEIHIDIRSEEEKKKQKGSELVNTGNPEVIELWNIVFMQYERTDENILRSLTKNFVDTGIGFERLCMVLQGKKSTYETDIFTEYMKELSSLCDGYKYNNSNNKKDISFRVISDHVRTIILCLIEGLKPSNIKEGYVLRMLIRRAQRYAYLHLGIQKPFLSNFIDIVVRQFESIIPTIKNYNKKEIQTVLEKEESSFLKVIMNGIKRLYKLIEKNRGRIISAADIFELKDTYGLPFEITETILNSEGINYEKEGYRE